MKIKTDKMLSELGRLNDEQFKVLFFIYNSINMNSGNSNRVKIYRAVLADLCGKSERTISRITDKLAEQGLILKDNVSDGSKLYNYYGIPKQKTNENLVTDVRVKEHKEYKVIKEQKEIKEEKKVEVKKDFSIECKEEQSPSSTVVDSDCFSMEGIYRKLVKASTKDEIYKVMKDFNSLIEKTDIPNEKIEQFKDVVKAKLQYVIA